MDTHARRRGGTATIERSGADIIAARARNALLAKAPAKVAEPDVEFDRTDLGNSIRFAAEHEGLIRFDHPQERWLIWTEHYWKPDYGPLLAQKVMNFVQGAYLAATAEEASIQEPKARRKTIHWSNANSARGMRAITEIAKNIPMLADDGRHWDETPHLLGVPNGVVDLTTGELRDGRPEDRITMQTRVPFDPTARAPRWEQFLQEVHPDEHDGAAIREYLRRAYGYSATGESREHIINFLTGTGRNGKSVERNAVLHVLGDYGYVLPFETLEQVKGGRNTNDLAPLHRKRMAVSSEANKGVRLDTRRIKALTGEDDISARYLFKEFATFRSTATLWVAVNDKPTVNDDSDGFWQRVRVVPYPRTFEGAEADPRLNETFQTDEALGILAWVIEGARRFYEDGLGLVPESIQATTRDYRAENDPIAEFIEDRCTRHAEGHVVFKDLYRELTGWAEYQGLPQKDIPDTREVKRYFRAHFAPWRNSTQRGFAGLFLSSEPPLNLTVEQEVRGVPSADHETAAVEAVLAAATTSEWWNE